MRSTFLTNRVVDPAKKLTSIGIIHLRRRALAGGAMLFAGLMLAIPTLPAFAELISVDSPEVKLQSFTTPVTAETNQTVRESYTVSEFSLVTAPTLMGSLSSGFGYRASPCAGCTSNHEGLDLTPGAGTPVYAVADGVVAYPDGASGALGVAIEIAHVIDGVNVTTVYAHMQSGSLTVTAGDAVTAGQQIGRVGNTGASTAPHLHFEVRPGGGNAIDPLAWLRAHINY
ncbi:MAG: M23 family metallopeptidase [Microbacteriaceae bacterium]